MSAATLLPVTAAWLVRNHLVESAVLFGSSAREQNEQGNPDAWSDLDLHVVTTIPEALESVDWASAIPSETFCLRVIRPATGGVRKVTAIFAAGQIDLVLVQTDMLAKAADGMQTGEHLRPGALATALNEMATCLHSGYLFLKGEKKWGDFYAHVAALPGVRINDAELPVMADIFLCDLLWILQKIERGELVAAQHALHAKLVDVNLRLWRELRRRRGLPLPSFGPGRRVESLSLPTELAALRVSAHANPNELQQAARQCFATLKEGMRELAPQWLVPGRMNELLARWTA